MSLNESVAEWLFFPLRNFLTDSSSEILQQHSALKYSDTKIHFDKKFEPIIILLSNLDKCSLITYFDIPIEQK